MTLLGVLSLAAILGSIAGCQGQRSEVKMKSPIDQIEQDIRDSIGYDRLLAGIDANAGIVLAWPDLRQFFPSEEHGWEVTSDEVDFTDQPGLVVRNYLYGKGEGQLHVEVFVSGRGPQPALERLVKTMAATSIGYRRYQRGPMDVGQLCLVLPASNPTVLVIDRNVFMSIRRNDHTIDVVALARRLTKVMDAHVVPNVAQQTPTFPTITVQPEEPKVGDNVKLTFTSSAAFPPNELMWAVSYDAPDSVQQRDRGADFAELRFLQPGRIEVPLLLADRRTLLSSETRVSVVVRP